MAKGVRRATSPCLELDVLSQVGPETKTGAQSPLPNSASRLAHLPDSEEERDNRNKIMDQAARGWFAAGYIDDGEDEKSRRVNSMQDESDRTSLSDDSLFESHEGQTDRRNAKERRRNLVQGVHTRK